MEALGIFTVIVLKIRRGCSKALAPMMATSSCWRKLQILTKKDSASTKQLRRGWSTGAMATAAAKAALEALLDGKFADSVSITLPGGTTTPKFLLLERKFADHSATAALRKDAGDDPDVTHGALIRVTVRLLPSEKIIFIGGEGVGRVTLPGLPLAVGEPAINPAPRAMMREMVKTVTTQRRRKVGAEITVSVPNGRRLAAKTWNGRLGIMGGISILGTSGVVVPYSCSAWVASIHRGVDVALAQSVSVLGAATGKTSASALQKIAELESWQVIDMGDFVGGLAKYLKKKMKKTTGKNRLKLMLAGGFGKLAKLAAGNMDLHSNRSQFSIHFLAELADSRVLRTKLQKAHSAASALAIARSCSKVAAASLVEAVALTANRVLAEAVGERVETETLIFNPEGRLLARA